jgi:hypothetical protein
MLIEVIISRVKNIQTPVHYSHSPTLKSVSLVPTVAFLSRMPLLYLITYHIPTQRTSPLNMRQHILLKHCCLLMSLHGVVTQ